MSTNLSKLNYPFPARHRQVYGQVTMNAIHRKLFHTYRQLKKAKNAAKRKQRQKEKEQAEKEGRPWPPQRKPPDPDKCRAVHSSCYH